MNIYHIYIIFHNPLTRTQELLSCVSAGVLPGVPGCLPGGSCAQCAAAGLHPARPALRHRSRDRVQHGARPRLHPRHQAALCLGPQQELQQGAGGGPQQAQLPDRDGADGAPLRGVQVRGGEGEGLHPRPQDEVWEGAQGGLREGGHWSVQRQANGKY